MYLINKLLYRVSLWPLVDIDKLLHLVGLQYVGLSTTQARCTKLVLATLKTSFRYVIRNVCLSFAIVTIIFKCAIPCFEGLFPEPDNTHVMRLLYTMAYWHSLAKMRMHTESSVCLLDNAHTAMATHLRHFEKIVCPRYTTKETQKEYAKRVRTETKRTTKTTVETNTRATGRKTKSFNLSTVKTHLLGYYPSYIRTYGTMDLLSTLRVSTSASGAESYLTDSIWWYSG